MISGVGRVPDGSLVSRRFGTWVVTSDAERLVVEQDRGGHARKAVSALGVGVGAAAVAVFLGSVAPPGLELVAWPVSGALGLVALLAVPGAVRSLRLALSRPVLAVSSAAVAGIRRPAGLVASMSVAPRTFTSADIADVRLVRSAHPPLTLSSLEVVTRSGVVLEGPEVAFQGADDPLEPLAVAVARRLGRPAPSYKENASVK